MPKNDPAGYGKMQNPRYKGKTVRDHNPIEPGNQSTAPRPINVGNTKAEPYKSPMPVGGKPGKGKGWGPGGRFGRGGWQASGQKMKKNFMAKTAEQEEESKRKQAMQEAKRKSVKTRLSAIKKGPNEKQSQLLGGE